MIFNIFLSTILICNLGFAMEEEDRSIFHNQIEANKPLNEVPIDIQSIVDQFFMSLKSHGVEIQESEKLKISSVLLCNSVYGEEKIDQITLKRIDNKAKSLEEAPLSTMSWTVAQYFKVLKRGGVIVAGDEGNIDLYMKINGDPVSLKEKILELRIILKENKSLFKEEDSAKIIGQLDDFHNRVDNFLSTRHIHPLLGYFTQKNKRLPRVIMFPFDMNIKDVLHFIQSMPNCVTKEVLLTIYQNLKCGEVLLTIHKKLEWNEVISKEIPNADSAFLNRLRNILPPVQKPITCTINSENLWERFVELEEQYKHIEEKPLILKLSKKPHGIEFNFGEIGSLLNQTSLRVIGLDFTEQQLGIEEIMELTELLKENHTIIHLCLWGCFIGCQGAQLFGKVLKTNDTLLSLDLGNNEVGHREVKFIAEGLKENKALKFLSLTSNDIDGKGAQWIAEALMVNKSLTTLWLAYNCIDDKGLKFLAEALKSNRTLLSLRLYDNTIKDETQKIFYEKPTIGDVGAKYLAEALKVNKSLSFLDMDYCDISDEGAKHLVEASIINKFPRSVKFYSRRINRSKMPYSIELESK